MLNYVPIDATITFDVPTHDPDTGNLKNANSAPLYDVFNGANDTPLLAAQSMTLRTGKTGIYRGTIVCSAANGFTADSSINVDVTAAVTGTVSGNTITAGKTALTFRVGVTAASAGVVPASVAGAVGSVTGNVGGNINGNVSGSVGTVLDISSGSNTELTSVPASTATLRDMMKWVFMSARNRRTQTATSQIVTANDGSTPVGTSTVSDNGTTAVRGVFT